MSKPKFMNKDGLPIPDTIPSKIVSYLVYGFFGMLALAGFTWALGLFLKGLKAILVFVGVM